MLSNKVDVKNYYTCNNCHYHTYKPNDCENVYIYKIMNKTELIDSIAASAGISKADAKKALDATTEAIKNALVAGDKVQLVGFGTFAVTERPARQGINPKTKQAITIEAKKVAKFKAGAELAAAVN